MVGTPFQLSVWKALKTIPYGSTISYLELAKLIGDKKAVRAVAAANGANGIALMIPCHRVIGSNNKLVGYAGGLPVKKRLLKLEMSHSHNPNELPFFLADESRNDAFLAKAKTRGLLQLKGYKTLGGMRASLYNAMPMDGVQTLISLMCEFERTQA